MKRSYWIWNWGDYEIFHSNLVAARREELGADYPVFWRLPSIEHNVRMFCDFTAQKDGYIRLVVKGTGQLRVDDVIYKTGERVKVKKGKHTVLAMVINPKGLPCAYADSDICPSGEGWYTVDGKGNKISVGYDEHYSSENDDPEVFPFAYERLSPVSVKKEGKGYLYDFGKEVFGYLNIDSIDKDKKIKISYGESYEEATDHENSILYEEVSGKESYRLRPRAFRYIFCLSNKKADISCDHEYLPLEYKGSFRCNNEMINRVWDISAYTFHLNTREVFLDGVKRDRWCWSGDAYQCFKFNNYLFFDQNAVKRTLTALRGNNEMTEHINTITDYSLYWVIALWEYYMSFKDEDYIRHMFDKAVSLLEFVKTRENKDGFIIGKYNDWVFVDWTDMDKTGAVCAEQMLYAEAYRAMGRMAKVIGRPSGAYNLKANRLIKKINEFYWDKKKGAFIDSYESGKHNVTRHANIFSVMYGIATPEQKESIIKNVINNGKITKITTPFFEGYELDVMGEIGNYKYIEDMLMSYWGGMIKLGATTVWEEYDPKLSGIDHYKMYRGKYSKSLCHAWGASPIYLLGKYYLGVSPNKAGYEEFTVKPQLGGLREIEGSVPVNGGTVRIKMNKKELFVSCDKKGGTLIYKGKTYRIEPGKEYLFKS